MLRHTPFQTKAKRVMKKKVLIVRPDLSPDDYYDHHIKLTCCGKENGRPKKIRVSRIVKSFERKKQNSVSHPNHLKKTKNSQHEIDESKSKTECICDKENQGTIEST